MCDYSLHAVATRPADVAETLVSTNFSTGTGGFASPDDPKVAVCLRPGTEIAFENEVQTGGMMFRRSVGDRLARFRQIALDKPYQHHDALEFSNGAIVLDDRFHEAGIEKPASMEPEVCWWIPRLRRAERGAKSWQHGGRRLRWR